jgi:hypothetical protein
MSDVVEVPHTWMGQTVIVLRRQVDDEEAGVDPYLFDEGYSIAASTGLTKV